MPPVANAIAIDDVNDSVAVRRAYEDATCDAVFARGYDEDRSREDVRATIGACASVLALYAHFTAKTMSRSIAIACVGAYFASLLAIASIARFGEGDASALTRAKTTTTRARRGVRVRVSAARFADVIEIVITRKEDRKEKARDALKVEVYCGEHVEADGTFDEDGYEAFVWEVLDAYERGKGRGAKVAIDGKKLK